MNNVDWSQIADGASSGNPHARRHSLYLAVTEFEKALTASGAKKLKRESLADVFERLVNTTPSLQARLESQPIPATVFLDLLRQAIQARNLGIHAGSGVDPGRCEWYTEVLRLSWLFLRTEFVTKERASLLARDFLDAHVRAPDGETRQMFSDVYLFGSLTRQSRHPEDIDLLLVDSLEVVTWLEPAYHHEPGFKELEMLRQIDLRNDARRTMRTKRNEAAIACGLLNLVAVDGSFGSTWDATRMAAAEQSDPLFFLNIAEEVLHFSPGQESWAKETGSITLFDELARVRRQLVDRGILGGLTDVTDTRHRQTVSLSLTGTVGAQLDWIRQQSLLSALQKPTGDEPSSSLRSRSALAEHIFAHAVRDEMRRLVASVKQSLLP